MQGQRVPPVQVPRKTSKALSCVSKRHFLAFAHIGSGKHHTAVEKPDMCHLYGRRHPVDQNDLVAPIKLVGLAGRVVEWDIGFGR
ncbi:hypothetical protein A6R70_19925 [Agrobacterium rubi]|nr:hypothetical protein [Agrobacterium rubi]